MDGWPALSPSAAAVLTTANQPMIAAAFTWWNRAQRVLIATETAATNITLAVQIPILGWIFFNEQLGLAEVAGMALVVAGVLAMRARRQPNSPG